MVDLIILLINGWCIKIIPTEEEQEEEEEKKEVG